MEQQQRLALADDLGLALADDLATSENPELRGEEDLARMPSAQRLYPSQQMESASPTGGPEFATRMTKFFVLWYSFTWLPYLPG